MKSTAKNSVKSLLRSRLSSMEYDELTDKEKELVTELDFEQIIKWIGGK